MNKVFERPLGFNKLGSRALACAALLALAPLTSDASSDDSLFVRNASIIDGTGAAPQSGADILIQNGKIVSIGTGLNAPAEVRVIDASGKFLVPGLIDTHVHYQFPVTFQLSKKEEQHVLESAPKAYLYNGVTTTLDAGATAEFIFPLREAQREGQITAPRIHAVGPGFTPEKGWGSRHGRALRDAEAVKERMQALKDLGADGVKIIIEDGLGHAGTHVEMSDKMLAATLATARAADMRIYVHAINLTEYHRSVAFRPQAIIHGMEDPIPAGDSILRDLVANGVIVTPTISLFESFLAPDPRAGEGLDDPILVASVPTPVLDKLRSRNFVENSRAAFVKASNMDAYAWARKHNPIFCENIGRMHRAGVKLAVGTDAGGQVGFNFHGYNTPWEMKLFVKCGLTPMEALVAGTRNGAELLGIDAQLGTVEEGKLADLLVLTANPLDDIENIRAIESIIMGGRLHARDEFAYRK